VRKAEAAFQAQVRDLGCCVCIREGLGRSPAEIHHMLSAGRRMGEMFVLGLCPLHHRSGRNDAEVVSRDHNQRRFEARYGTEAALLAWTQDHIAGAGKVVARRAAFEKREAL